MGCSYKPRVSRHPQPQGNKRTRTLTPARKYTRAVGHGGHRREGQVARPGRAPAPDTITSYPTPTPFIQPTRSERPPSVRRATEWNVRDLVNHVVSEDLWAPPLLAGSTIAES